MSHPDPLFDPDNAYEDDDMVYHDDTEDSNYDDYNDFYNDSMDGDHDSAMTSCGWGTDEDYGYYGEDVDYREDFHSDDSYGCYGEDY
jgi:hypothetical protein